MNIKSHSQTIEKTSFGIVFEYLNLIYFFALRNRYFFFGSVHSHCEQIICSFCELVGNSELKLEDSYVYKIQTYKERKRNKKTNDVLARLVAKVNCLHNTIQIYLLFKIINCVPVIPLFPLPTLTKRRSNKSFMNGKFVN